MEEWEKNLPSKQKGNVKVVKEGKYYAQLRARGLVPFTKEWGNAVKALSRKEPANRAKINERRRAYRKEFISEYREEEKKRKRIQREKESDNINAINRKNYHKQRELSAAKQNERRHKREPHRAIRSATELFVQGLLTHEQYNQQVGGAIEQAQRNASRERGKGEDGGQAG